MVGQVYKYWTNDDGQITKMTSVITPANMSANIDASDYRYDADADRLVDNAGKYVASLEDANVIFAVKPNTGSAATNGANFTTVNAGYIQVEDTNSDGVGEDFYVDVDDVLAVKQSDIPDIELSTGTDANTTNANKLDNKTTAAITRARTWLGANNSAGTDYTNTFVAEIDSNGKASAAILGVEDFNKFGAGSTKIALVTDVTYANSTDGKYVELTGAFGGENKTIASTKKVAFGDIVKAYDAGTHTDVTVDNPSAKAAGTLFANVELDKYLEDGAAYAEVTTDGDGNLTKVTFLDYNNYNELAGHYYTVSRNITLGATNKSINYMFNDGTTQSAGSNVYIAKQYYASDSKLYSVPENLAKTNEAFTDDVTFYSIDGAATRGDKNYTGTELTVVDGFQRNPKITAGEDYTVVENSSIDNESNKDSYEVADIARKNNGDVAAVYAFNDSFDEADASGVAIVSMADNTGKAITSAKAGDAVQLTAVVVDSNVAKTLTGVQIVDANGNDVTTAWSAHDSTPTGNNKVYIDTTVTIPASANGKYTIYAVNGTTKYTVGALEVSVTGGVVTMYKVDDMKFKYQDENSDWQDGLQVDAAAQNTFYVGVSGTANGTTPLAAVSNPVSGLTAANFEVLYKGIPSEIYSVTEVAGEPGLYKFVMKNDLPEGQNVTVNVKATGIVNAIDTSMQNGITSVVTTSGSTTAPITFDKVVPLASATSTDVTVGASVKSGSDYYFMLTNKGAGVASDAVSLKKGFDTATVAGDGSGVYKATGASAGVWKILVDGVDTGKTVEFVDAASIALESYSDITVDLLDEVNEEYAVTIKGMKEADLANIKVGKDSLGGTASATDNGITVAYADNKVTVTGTPTAVAAQATFKVGVSGTEADVKVTVSKVTVTAEAVMKDASNMTVTLKKGDAVLTKEQVDKLVSGSDLTTVGNWTLTDDASSQTNPSAVSIEADGTLKVTLKTPLSDSESAGATVTAGTNYKAITVPAATYTQA